MSQVFSLKKVAKQTKTTTKKPPANLSFPFLASESGRKLSHKTQGWADYHVLAAEILSSKKHFFFTGGGFRDVKIFPL